MKTLFSRVLLAGAALFCSVALFAQNTMPIPVDKNVRIGKLSNGLTYYIRHNETPKGQADFYIAQKVGSILEEENQRGLAHFLEHMCFNGTKNFPGNSLIDWCESVGIKFGYNLNAYTSIDQTVYNISNVPVTREGIQDSCLLILHDWANDLLLDPAEIEKERGVIHQEWRMSMVGQMRILENILPTIYESERYGYRLPIGTIDVIDNFAPQALRDYYETWYRPDQQGIIVVGDIDVDRIESKIKELFSSIEMPADSKERQYYPVADNKGTIFAIGSDPEQEVGLVSLMFKTDAFPKEMKGDITYLMVKYMTNMISMMLNNRFVEMMTNPDVEFAQASAGYGEFFIAKTKEMFNVDAVSKDGNVEKVLEAVYREVLRAARGGFTFGEYDRVSKEYMSRLEKSYNSRNQRQTASYVNEYVNHFLDNEPIPSIEEEYQLMQMLAPNVNVDMINQVFRGVITADNRVVMALLPEKEGVNVPTAETLESIMKSVDNEDIAPYVDEMKSEPLIPALPTAGKVVKQAENKQWGATELTLSNGVKVLIKPTKYKEDEILFVATAVGGTSVLPASYDNEILGLEVFLSQKGLGNYTYSDLQKYLAGKQVSVSTNLYAYYRTLTGSSTVKDLPTLMELIYMNFTNINITEEEAQALKAQYAGMLENQESNPQFIFQKNIYKSIFSSPRSQVITSDIIRSLDREKMLEIPRKMTANAADFQFVFVGDVNLDTIIPLLEQYVATLPADTKKVTNKAVIDMSQEFKPGKGVETFTTKMATPQTYVFLALSDKVPYTGKNSIVCSIVGQVLSNRLLKTVREDMGAVYSISAQGSMDRVGYRNVMLQSAFPMKPEMKQEVLDFIDGCIANMENDVTAEELATATEYMLKNAAEKRELNSGWINAMGGAALNGVDTFNNKEADIKSVTVDDVKTFVKKLRAAGNYRVVVLDPEQ